MVGIIQGINCYDLKGIVIAIVIYVYKKHCIEKVNKVLQVVDKNYKKGLIFAPLVLIKVNYYDGN